MTMRKMTALLLVGMLAAGSFGCKKKDAGEAPKATAGDTVKIGFLGALTGDVAMFGKPTLEGMKMAAEELNAAGGVLGKKLICLSVVNKGIAFLPLV